MKALKFIALSIAMLIVSITHCLSQNFESYRTLKDTTYISQNLGYKKHIQITVPKAYQDNLSQSFPLIIIFDMQNSLNYHYMLQSIDYLTSNSQMPSAVIIGVEAGEDSKRWVETQLKVSFARGLGEKNEDYIFKELIPLSKIKYKASDFTILIGHSRYGYFTSYLLAKHLNQLNAVISMSPFLEQTNINLATILADAVAKSDLKHDVYYRFAMGNDYPEDYKKLLQVIRSDSFKNKKMHADGWLFPLADHLTTPGLTITRSLYEIFEFWSSYQDQYISEKNKDVNNIDAFSNAITAHYGMSLPNSIGILNGKGWAFYNNSDYVNALSAWQQLVRQYPGFSEGYLDIAKCQKKLQQSTEKSLVNFKLSLKESFFYSEAEKADMLQEAGKL